MLTNNLDSEVSALIAPAVDALITRPYRSTFGDFDQAAFVLVSGLSEETLNDLYQAYLQDHRFMLGSPVDFDRWLAYFPQYVSAGIRLDYIKRTK